jgi:hypothetical protein
MNKDADLGREIAEEDELRSLLRAGDRETTAPPFTSLDQRGARRGTCPGKAALIGAAVIGVVAISLVRSQGVPLGAVPSATAQSTSVGNGVLTAPSPSATASLETARAAAIAGVTAESKEVIRVDHVDAKLVRWSEFETIAHTGNANVDDRDVWVVAVSGEVQPQFATSRGPFASEPSNWRQCLWGGMARRVQSGARHGRVWSCGTGHQLAPAARA